MVCNLCDGTQWMDIRVDPVPPWSDFMSVDMDADPCWVCNPEGQVPYPGFEAPIPYWLAMAIGGFEGQYGLFQRFDDGQLVRSVLVHRSVANYSSWQPPLPIEDCPVCLGWGVWSNNGQIQDCIACGGKPIEARQGFEPLHAWWVNWKLGHKELYTQRGVAAIHEMEEARRSDPNVTTCMVAAIENIPGMVRIS